MLTHDRSPTSAGLPQLAAGAPALPHHRQPDQHQAGDQDHRGQHVDLRRAGPSWRRCSRTAGRSSVDPALNSVMMKSSSDRANDSIAAATMPGDDQRQRDPAGTSGSGWRPRSIAASSRLQSKPRIRAFTVRATKLIWNMTWASTMVREAQVPAEVEEQGEQRRAEHDLGRGQRDHQEQVDAAGSPEPVAHQGDGHQRAEDHGDDRGQRRHLQAGAPGRRPAPGTSNGSAQASREKPFQTKLNLPDRLVEREGDDHHDRQEQVEEDEAGVGVQEPAADAPQQRRRANPTGWPRAVLGRRRCSAALSTRSSVPSTLV